MLTKPSPDAIKMLKSIEEYFNQAFSSNKYSVLFRREFYNLFKIDFASPFSIYGSNDAYILGLGIIDCWELEKNIERIENRVNSSIKEKEERILRLENLVPLVENDKKDGKIDSNFVELFYQTLEEAHKWETAEDDNCVHLPFILSSLNGKPSSDYKTVFQDLSQRVEWRKEAETSKDLYKQFCDWLDMPSTKKQFGIRRWNAMKEKLALRDEFWFSNGKIKDIESAKKIMSEVFYPDQEEYYKQLEKWAKSEIEDEDCSKWIEYYLWNGRTLPVRQVQILRYKGNLEKGKAFLLSKYQEKLGWDKKKKKDRESLFKETERTDYYTAYEK